MSQIQQLLNLLTNYQTMMQGQSAQTLMILTAIQDWQSWRIRQSHPELFYQSHTKPLAEFFINQVYHHRSFDILAEQLITACQNALSGVGKLEQLIPNSIMQTGLLSLQASIEAITLDLQLAKLHQQNGGTATEINAVMMPILYRQANAKNERISQIQNIHIVCTKCYHSFNSFIIQQALKLAKNRAYQNGYQPLYDFIFAGLHAIRTIRRIDDFTQPFIQKELHIIEQVHDLTTNNDDILPLFVIKQDQSS